MKILLVAATEDEISPLRTIVSPHSVDFLVTGPGMVSTVYELSKKLLEHKYDLAINAGIAGSFDRLIAIGEVVLVNEDIFSELGAENGNHFINTREMGLNSKDTFLATYKAKIPELREVKSITVNTVHGNEDSISKIESRLHPQTETMEGAAFFYVCERENIPAMQLRAISNYVERRNKNKWNIPLAILNLQNTLSRILTSTALGQEVISDNHSDLKKKQIQSTEHQNSKNGNVLKLGISPCPNDTFIFDALINKRIDTDGITFEVRFEDVETLNKLAVDGEMDIIKISFAAYSSVMDKYQLLTSGSALGNGVGPLLISKKKFKNSGEIKSVAIPGKNTTANFLFRMFYPEIRETPELVFSAIEDAVINEKVDAGVIIHENRFTYAEKGLSKISDLGELWEKKTGQPIPLGGIAVKRSLDENLKKKINELVAKSVNHAFAHPEQSREFVSMHAQEMSEEVRQKHISLYVNNYSINLGHVGKTSIIDFLNFSKNNKIIFKINDIFVGGE